MKLLSKPPPLPFLPGSLKETHTPERLAQLKKNFSLESGIFVVLCCVAVCHTQCFAVYHVWLHTIHVHLSVSVQLSHRRKLCPFLHCLGKRWNYLSLMSTLYFTPREKNKQLENAFCSFLLAGVQLSWATSKHLWWKDHTGSPLVKLVCSWCCFSACPVDYWQQSLMLSLIGNHVRLALLAAVS